MFLGKAVGGFAKFLGHAHRGARFIGKALPVVATGAVAARSFANNPSVQAMAQKAGVKPGLLDKFNAVTSGVATVAGAIPGVAKDVGTAATSAVTALAPARRSIADLYQAANRK